MAKIKRNLFAQYLHVQSATPAYTLIGVDNEELVVEMGANVVKQANVLGQTSTSIDKYEKSMSVEPYKADSGTDLHTWLQEIIDEQRTLDDLKTDIVEVQLWETATGGAFPAFKEECVIEVVSYGGNTEGYQIPFNLHFTGVRTAGTFNPSTKVFTASV